MKPNSKKFLCLITVITVLCLPVTASAAETLRPVAFKEKREAAGENYFSELSYTQRVIVALYAIKNFYIGSSIDVMAIGRAGLNVLSQAEIGRTYELERRLPEGFRERIYNILAGVMLNKITGIEAAKMLRSYSPQVFALGNEAIVREVIRGLRSFSEAKPKQPPRRVAASSPAIVLLVSENAPRSTILKLAINRNKKYSVILADDLDSTIGYLKSGSIEGQRIGAVILDLHVIRDADSLQRLVTAARAGNVDTYVLFQSEQTLLAFSDIIKTLGRGHSIQETPGERSANLAGRIELILDRAAPEPIDPVRETDAAI